ncbi:type II toxin-antitoxin system RelB/DinJ family antitoxin [Lacticaseibacillus hegangensis]|uniref:Type II toxin-antitoxin system RelB/DinJ family antitoxin n=1 Tax=Lacticaseibacillus hegangensis TaxID=2486010 RepID=A0ABW4CR49_9LACO|nr:type II toxin-antitoxin system RelB/DinJ family antitoxin [Lacticaseibacillus hegangensis]
MATKKKEVQLNIRIDSALKTAGQEVAKDLGIDLNTAINLFIAAMVRTHRLPFEPSTLPSETLEALHESDHSKAHKTYDNAEDMWRDLNV